MSIWMNPCWKISQKMLNLKKLYFCIIYFFHNRLKIWWGRVINVHFELTIIMKQLRIITCWRMIHLTYILLRITKCTQRKVLKGTTVYDELPWVLNYPKFELSKSTYYVQYNMYVIHGMYVKYVCYYYMCSVYI